ncbi:MAG: asparagine synthase (glutamine-hydrolyzing) [Elusimicrobia bacterium RIFOXYA2_FULL_58_8]|nr:MAG: asparagine synthase (glutamine-hydrolyzing) [Elusimicrobia bacterium RIFOXYA2_FULL_58_8]
MCGICGFANYRNDGLLKGMAASLAHRGPDADGFFTDGDRVSLGMRRLKVIDLATGAQPMANEDGSVRVVFNGEIYNFKELRAELELKGHHFRSQSDTEVLVHLYEEYGEGMAARLRGMFAFAVWDSKTAALLLARDQFGVKPLFYALSGDKLFFASELKALPLGAQIQDELDPAAIDAYFTHLYIPAPRTIYKRVNKLEPAQTLVFRGGMAKITSYWRLPGPGLAAPRSEGEWLDAIDDLLGRSVAEQLVSDVPLGLLLSGGMDSSSALYYMSRALTAPVKTFTVGYGSRDASFNETEAARRLSAHFKTDHHEVFLDPDPRMIIEKMALHFDEPFADASAIPTYLVTAEARKKVTVALTGIGGDEMFGGYPRHLGARLLPAYLGLPSFFRNWLWAAARRLPESSGSRNTPGRIKRFIRGGRGSFRTAYTAWLSYFTRGEREQLYAAGLSGALAGPGNILPGRLAGPDDIFAFELRNYLSDDLLCLADRASMANSLELRVPFLDVRLAELMAGAPLALKTRSFNLKYLLKKLMAPRLPEPVLRGLKQGFQVPLARWYREDMRDFVREVLSPAALKKSGCLNADYAGELLDEHESGRRNLADQLHAAVTFELWLAARAKTAGGGFDPGIGARAGALTVAVATDIIPYDDEGGSGRAAWETARRLAAMGHKIIVLTKGAPGRRDFETVDGLEVHRYYGNPFRFRAAAEMVLKRYGKVDVLELHHPYTAALALRYFKGVPAVYNFHSPWGEEYAIRGADLGMNPLRVKAGAIARVLAERHVLKSSGIILNASRFMAAKLMAVHGLRSRVVPLGVNTAKFFPAADIAGLRRKLNIGGERFVVFTVRNLVSRMGLENLVEAAAEIVRQRPAALFIIGGRGYLREKLERMIAQRGLAGHVRLEGYIPEADLPLYYQCADLFVLPTRLLEGFGLVTLEALSCGTPVLATPVAANVEVLGGFGGEFLLKDESPGAIASGIIDFMAAPVQDKAALRGRCRAFIELNYSWDKYAAEVEKVLYEAANTR